MSQITVKGFAEQIGVPPETLLRQLAAAGVADKQPDDTLSDEEKVQLYHYLRASNGASDEGAARRKIALKKNVKELDGTQDPSGSLTLDQCEKITKRILSGVVIPWNKTIERAKAHYDAKTKEVDHEINKDLEALKEIRDRFSVLGLTTPEAAVQERLEDIATNPPQEVPENILDQCRNNVTRTYQTAKNIKEVKGESGNFYDAVTFKLYDSALFLGTWIIAGVIINGGVGLLLATAVTLMFPVFRALQITSAARQQWAELVRVVAYKHYWLNRLVLGGEQQAMCTTMQKLVEEKERIAKNINISIKSVYETGAYRTAVTADRSAWSNWIPEDEHVGVIRVGEQRVFVDALPEGFGHIAQGAGVTRGFTVPILASLKNGKSIYIRITDHARIEQGNSVAQNLILRILSSAPPAKVLFTFIDPIGQGQNAASFLELADYDESLINSKVWTDPRQIESKLADLTEHMETVIQKYLRKDYASIEDYNAAAGEIAEAYRVVVVFDFPDSISESAARQLERIVQNGGRCGVYAIIVHNTSKTPSYGVNEDSIAKHSLVFEERRGVFVWDNYGAGILQGIVELQLDGTPSEDVVKKVVKTIGGLSNDALKVEVPYPKLLQLAGIDRTDIWTENTTNGIRVPLGPGNARKPRFLELGTGLSVHALVVGRPGSGKSNLMHVVITTAARLYSPNELELYLIDFKKGVEFKQYAEALLPHARVIAIESEREFGLSVLRALDDKLKHRGEEFRALGVADIREYREKITNGENKLPRILLVVDEFQEFFVKEDAINNEAALLIDRIVRQGRAFGIHLFLGSQTLAGYSLPRSTLNLITIRIALQSSEADSRMILADDNTAARLLSRPGEGIYNASSGLVEGNNLFQVALFTEEDRSQAIWLIRKKYEEQKEKKGGVFRSFPRPIIFEGHEPALLEQCVPLSSLLGAAGWPEGKRAFEIWLGEPIAIRPPTAMKVAKRSGSHMLVVTKDEEEAIGILSSAVISIAAHLPPKSTEITILDLTTADAEWADVPENMAELLQPHQIKVIDRRALGETLSHLSELVTASTAGERKVNKSHFLVLLGMHRARDLRQEGYSSRLDLNGSGDKKPDMASQFASILRDGPESGVHVLAWCDSYSNLERSLDHHLITDFGTRIVGPMNNSDSVRLIDDDAAAQIDRPHRMIKYDEENVGVLETFRPYALAKRAWLEGIGKQLRKRKI